MVLLVILGDTSMSKTFYICEIFSTVKSSPYSPSVEATVNSKSLSFFYFFISPSKRCVLENHFLSLSYLRQKVRALHSVNRVILEWSIRNFFYKSTAFQTNIFHQTATSYTISFRNVKTANSTSVN